MMVRVCIVLYLELLDGHVFSELLSTVSYARSILSLYVKSCKISVAQADITFLALTKTPGEYLVPPDRSWFSEPIKICDLKLCQYIQGTNVSRLPKSFTNLCSQVYNWKYKSELR